LTESFEVKPISREGVPEAIKRAEHYRLLNEPEQAESICLDILAADPENERAFVVLLLATTDQFGRTGAHADAQKAREYLAGVKDQYQRTYYAGIICEREARVYLHRGWSSVFAYDGFRDAMDWYEKAAQIRPPGNDDAILRWNTCVRTIRRANLRPRVETGEQPLE